MRRRLRRSNPAAFAHDCFRWKEGQEPTFYQYEILEDLPVKKRMAVRGPHGLGKTAMASWVVLWFALSYDLEDWKAVTTASAWRQLTKFLWPEIHKWTRLLDWPALARGPFNPRTELFTLSLKLRTGEAFAVASDTPELIEGAHADHILYLLDEAKVIPAGTWDAIEGAFSGSGSDTEYEAYALSISTPGEPNGRFYDIHQRKPGYEDWAVRHVTLEEAIKAGRVSKEWADARKRQWGENSSIYQNRVEGNFASSDEDSVIPLSWIEAAQARWDDWHAAGAKRIGPMKSVGVDVARTGEDKTVLAPRWNNTITELRRFSKQDTMQTAGIVKGLVQAHGGKAIVDVIGVGAGVVDSLREGMKGRMARKAPIEVVAFNASESTKQKDRTTKELGFINKRSAAWWNMREMLDPQNGEDVALPSDDMLTGDLTAPHWTVTSSGKIQVESKDDIRERIGRSTDDGDAVVMAFWEDKEPRRQARAAGGNKR